MIKLWDKLRLFFYVTHALQLPYIEELTFYDEDLQGSC